MSDEHQEFLETLAESGMITSAPGLPSPRQQRFFALARGLHRADTSGSGRWVITGALVGAGLGLVVAGVIRGLG